MAANYLSRRQTLPHWHGLYLIGYLGTRYGTSMILVSLLPTGKEVSHYCRPIFLSVTSFSSCICRTREAISGKTTF